jgi:hypothetical protein
MLAQIEYKAAMARPLTGPFAPGFGVAQRSFAGCAPSLPLPACL